MGSQPEHLGLQFTGQLAEPGEDRLQCQIQLCGGFFCAGLQYWVIGLREVDHPPVVGKELLFKRRMLIQFETLYHQPVEVPDQKVGEVKGARLLGCQCVETVFRREHAVAVGTCQPFDLAVRQDSVEAVPQSP